VAKLETIKSLSKQHADLLRDNGRITSISVLLKVGARPAGRQRLAEAAGVDPDEVLVWVHLADLLRIKGIGQEYLSLLGVVGVHTVEQLKVSSPHDLYQALKEANSSSNMVSRLPTPEMIADWIEQASELPPSIEY